MQIKLMTAEVNGKKIAFSSETVFLVQVSGSNRKSAYKTVACFKGAEFQRMTAHFQGINISNGRRKRILMTGSVKNGGILIKQRST